MAAGLTHADDEPGPSSARAVPQSSPPHGTESTVGHVREQHPRGSDLGTSHPDWDIRRAQPSDVLAVAEFQTECWREAYRGVVPASYLAAIGTDERIQRWHTRLAPGGREVLIAWVDGQVGGVVSSGLTKGEPRLEVMSLYVRADLRGTGLAAELLGSAVGSAAAKLWVFEQNPRAHRFYRKLGFIADGARSTDSDTGLMMIRLVRSMQQRP